MSEAKDLLDVFEKHHARYPEIYVMLAFLTRDAIARGLQFGIQTFWEIARYGFAITGGKGPVFDDRLRPYYSRLLMEQEHDIDGYFTTRVLRRGT